MIYRMINKLFQSVILWKHHVNLIFIGINLLFIYLFIYLLFKHVLFLQNCTLINIHHAIMQTYEELILK